MQKGWSPPPELVTAMTFHPLQYLTNSNSTKYYPTRQDKVDD